MKLTTILLVMVFIGIVVYEIPGLIQKKLWGELWAFSVLWLMGFVLTFLMAMGVTIPIPIPPLPQ